MAKRDPEDEIRRILAGMKANGVTISYKPATGDDLPHPGERAMGIVHREAQKLGMTYDDPEPVHWIGDAPTSLHGNGAASFNRTTPERARVTCTLCRTILDRREPTETGENDGRE